MNRQRIFLSSVQKEFADDRRKLQEYVHAAPLLRRFFEMFFFENVPATDRRADDLYLDEVSRCDLYLALLGDQYGWEDAEGLSPAHREFLEATRLGKRRLVYVKGTRDETRHPKMQTLIQAVGSELIRRRFSSMPELHAAVYASLVQHLESIGLIRTGPFDASACRNAGLDDLSSEKVHWFLTRARRARDYALGETTPLPDVLTHLNLLDGGKPSHAAVLLSGSRPQRFLISSEVKCLHFHGTRVRKPIPSYQIYKGTIFELVDQAVDFVMSKLNRRVGTREHGPEAPVTYEIPQTVVAEAIVNAVAHRDYTSNASVQVMLFTDRLEVWNPGTLPPALTLEALRRPHASLPLNPLIAEPLFLAKYIEKADTGTLDMIDQCCEEGLPEPEFRLDAGCFVTTIHRGIDTGTEQITEQVTEQVGTKSAPSRHQVGTMSALSRHQVEILEKCREETVLVDLMAIAGRSDRTKFRHQVLGPLFAEGLIEMTIPDKPRSRNQKYRLCPKGKAVLEERNRE